MVTIASVMIASAFSGELAAYVARPDPAIVWRAVSGSGGLPKALTVSSQKWQGIVWKHDVTLAYPSKVRSKGVCMIQVTGDRVGLRDDAEAKRVADLAGIPVATLYQVPNQPLFGAKEDALIAITFQKYLETQNANWPLLFPMAKSVVSTMNALQETTKSGANPIRRFIVYGGSKRGWTTWLSAATGDRRIIGIAPVVYDNLNVVEQMKQQKASMGDYSPMIRDYVKSGLLAALETPKGQRLASLVDPFAYRASIKIPVLSINGGNDSFWAPDANRHYWDRLAMPKSLLVVPNAGHSLGDRKWMEAALGAFGSAVASGRRLPSISAKLTVGNQGLQFIGTSTAKPSRWTVYACTYYDWDFVKMPWRKIAESGSSSSVSTRVARPIEGKAALIAVGEFRSEGRTYWLSSPTLLLQPSGKGSG